MKILKRRVLKELKEAVTGDEVEKIINQYASKVSDPEAKKTMARQAINQLGKSSTATPEDLGMSLRKYYAQNYDPVKMAQKQAGQQAMQQQKVKSSPPPLPGQSSTAQPVPFSDPGASTMPSLSALANQETQPLEPWNPQKAGLPDIEAQPQADDKTFSEPPMPSLKQAGEPSVKPPVATPPALNKAKAPAGGGEDIPMAKASDVKTVKSTPAVKKQRAATAKTFAPPGVEPAPIMHQTAAEPVAQPKKAVRGRPKQAPAPVSKVKTPNLSQLAYRKTGKFV